MIDERCGAGVPHPRYLAVLSPPCSGHCGFITHSQIMTQEEEKGGKEKTRRGGGAEEIICTEVTLERRPIIKCNVKEKKQKKKAVTACKNTIWEIM
jgi:hypothetical protein